MRADKIIVIIILAVIIGVIWLLWLNRGSEKIFGASLVVLTTTMATGLGSLLVILRPETRTEEFLTVFIYDSKEDRPLLVESYPIRKRLGLDSALWAHSEENQGESNVPKQDINDRLLDFLMRCMVERMYERYYHAWSIEAKAWSVPGSDQFSWGASKDAEKLKKKELLKDDLLQQMALSGNTYARVRSETGGLHGKIALPPSTDVAYTSRTGERTLMLINPFVRMRITAHFNSMNVLQHPYYDVFQIDKRDRNRYRQVSFRIHIHAEYSSWRAGWEMMTHQKRWAESLIVMYKEKFDWAPIAEEIKTAWTTSQLQKL